MAERVARQSAALQTEFNNLRGEGTVLKRLAIHHSNPQVEYWDVPPGELGLQTWGDISHSPFATAKGKVRIYNHFLDDNRRNLLVQRFGKPTGQVAAELTTSIRTVKIFPKDELPFELKFSGENFMGGRKKLLARDVEVSVKRSEILAKNPFIVAETAGLVLQGMGENPLTTIYRPLRLPKLGFRRGQLHVPAHVVTDPAFAESTLGQRRFAQWGGQKEWLMQALMPKVADVMVQSLLDGTHLEIHGQNIELTIDSVGNIVDVGVKDLLDVKFDPILMLARTGKMPAKRNLLREDEWGFMGEGTDWTPRDFYGHWLEMLFGQHRLTPASIDWDQTFNRHVLAAFERNFGIELDHESLPRSGYQEVAGYELARQHLIGKGVARHFRVDSAAKALLGNPELDVWQRIPKSRVLGSGSRKWRIQQESTVSPSMRGITSSEYERLTFGFLGKHPAAVLTSKDGNFEDVFVLMRR